MHPNPALFTPTCPVTLGVRPHQPLEPPITPPAGFLRLQSPPCFPAPPIPGPVLSSRAASSRGLCPHPRPSPFSVLSGAPRSALWWASLEGCPGCGLDPEGRVFPAQPPSAGRQALFWGWGLSGGLLQT